MSPKKMRKIKTKTNMTRYVNKECFFLKYYSFGSNVLLLLLYNKYDKYDKYDDESSSEDYDYEEDAEGKRLIIISRPVVCLFVSALNFA